MLSSSHASLVFSLFLCEYDDEVDADKLQKSQCNSWAEAQNGKWAIT